MDAYQTEEQQIEQLKKVWDKYQKLVLTVLMVVLITVVGYKYNKHHANVQSGKASNEYQLLLDAVAKHDDDTIRSQSALLMDDYKRTPYADFAAMIAAKVAIDENNFDLAKQKLQWVVAKNKKSKIWHIAKVRLARILMEEGKIDDALDELHGNYNGYTSLFEEVKGDIYVAQDNEAQAITSYRTALLALPEQADNSWILLKLKDLGEKV